MSRSANLVLPCSSSVRIAERDILSNTSEVEYAVVNRLYAKHTSEKPENCDATGMASLIIGHPAAGDRSPGSGNWIAERSRVSRTTGAGSRYLGTRSKYFLDPTFGGALVPGQRNVFTTTADFTGIAFLTEARPVLP